MTKQWLFPIANVLFKGSMRVFADYSVRRTSPLRPANEAHILHTDDMTLEQVVDRMAELVEAAR